MRFALLKPMFFFQQHLPTIQESYNTPLEHTPGKFSSPTMKGFPLQPIGVLKQP